MFSSLFLMLSSCAYKFHHFLHVLRYGKKNMLWYILVCSMIGGISVSVTTGLGSAIVTTAMGDNQVRSLSRSLWWWNLDADKMAG